MPTDVTDPARARPACRMPGSGSARSQLLINNAGIETIGLSWGCHGRDMARKEIGVNLLGVIHGVRAFTPGMLEEGKPAHIVNIASLAALGMMPITAPYMVTKHAVLAFSECLKLEMDVKTGADHRLGGASGAIATTIFTDAPGVDGDPTGHRPSRDRGEMLAQGLSPEEAAERIFAQLDEGRFWVSPNSRDACWRWQMTGRPISPPASRRNCARGIGRCWRSRLAGYSTTIGF